MQLSASTAPVDPTLAAFFAPGATPPAAAEAPAGEGATPFAQLFPDLASAPATQGKNPAGPVPAAAPETTSSWSMAGLPLAKALNRTEAALAAPGAVVTGSPGSEVSAPLVTNPTPTPGLTGNVPGAPFSANGRRGAVGSLRASDAPVVGAPSPTLASTAVGVDVAPGAATKTSRAVMSRASEKIRADATIPPAEAVNAPASCPTPALPVAASGVQPPSSSLDGAAVSASPAATASSLVSFAAPAPSESVSPPTDSVCPVFAGARRSSVLAFTVRAPLVPTPSRPSTQAAFGAVASDVGAVAVPSPVAGEGATMIGAQPVSADHPVFAGELASRYLAPTPPQSPATQGAAEIAPAATASGPTATPEATGADLIAQLMPAAASETAATPSVTSSASTPIAAATLAATQDFAAASHAESFLGGRGEKFAAPNEKSGFEKISTAAAPEKTFLTALEKRVTPDEADLGIDVAKSLPAMSAATFSNHPATAAVLEHASVPVEAMAPAWMASSSLSASEATGTAHRAVEAVLTAVERFSSGDQHAVNLQFSVGGADLNVRVEMRADEVRTMFRTDSPELRAALAQEWQTVNSGAADRTLRLASPVFSAADHSNLAAFSGDSAPRQRDSGARRAADETFASVAGPARPARFTPPVLDEVAAAASRLIPSPSVLHLHALA